MDFKKLLSTFDAVENDTSENAVNKKKEAGSMLAILESFNRAEDNNDIDEAVGEFAAPLFDLVDQVGEEAVLLELGSWMSSDDFTEFVRAVGQHSDLDEYDVSSMPDLIELIGEEMALNEVSRWMSGDDINEFVGDFRRLYDMNNNDVEESLEESKMADMMIAASEMSKEEFSKEYPNFAKDYEKLRKQQTTEESLEEAIMVSAEGDEAAQLLSILQLAGMPAPAPAPMEPEMGPEMGPEMDMQDEYSNSPEEFEQDVDAVIASGDDMHREKNQYAAAQDGDNPMKAFEGKFKSIMDELLAEDNEEELEEAQSPAQKAAFEKMLAAKKGNKADDKDEEKEECRYCGGDCPNDEHHACDGYLGDIDGLYEEAVAVNESAEFSDMKNFMKRLNG